VSLFKKEKKESSKESSAERLRRIADEEAEFIKYAMEKSLDLEDHWEQLKKLKNSPRICEAKEELRKYRESDPELEIDWDICDAFSEGLVKDSANLDFVEFLVEDEIKLIISLFYKTLIRVAKEKNRCYVCREKQ
jgi:hypothetical protein